MTDNTWTVGLIFELMKGIVVYKGPAPDEGKVGQLALLSRSSVLGVQLHERTCNYE